MTNNHDARYKRFFSNPTLLRELLESFVPEDFVHGLDFSTLKRIDKSFVTEEYRERESDLIHEVRCKDSSVYIFLLIEFQRKVDRMMPLRFLRYICEFYQSLARNRQLGRRRKLPAVFPLLLYSGSRRWTASGLMQDLIDDRGSMPSRFVPHFEYCMVDENAYTTETLLSIRNTVAALFLAEKTPEDKLSDIDRMLYTLVEGEDSGAVRELLLWLRNVLGEARILADELPELAGNGEEHTMLAETIRKHDKKVFAEGRQEGETEGRQAGLRLAALRLKEKGHNREEIARLLEMSLDDVP
jgi:predicted transposase/invertase (TIGR01784 family)